MDRQTDELPFDLLKPKSKSIFLDQEELSVHLLFLADATDILETVAVYPKTMGRRCLESRPPHILIAQINHGAEVTAESLPLTTGSSASHASPVQRPSYTIHMLAHPPPHSVFLYRILLYPSRHSHTRPGSLKHYPYPRTSLSPLCHSNAFSFTLAVTVTPVQDPSNTIHIPAHPSPHSVTLTPSPLP
ncbi:hypothetical protein J6590_073137 [Homalodisca vitripennis]|nr:hypothetical protein J6590_073137 [Homalodisca vitripennis]